MAIAVHEHYGDERPRAKSFSPARRGPSVQTETVVLATSPRGKRFGGKPGGGKNFSGKSEGRQAGWRASLRAGPSRGGPKSKGNDARCGSSAVSFVDGRLPYQNQTTSGRLPTGREEPVQHSEPCLSECVDGTRILDLFAGTGAVGLQAVSRGCRHALFVENSVEGGGLLWENIDALGLHGRTRILRRDATDLGSVGNLEPFQMLFADPPYGKGLGEKAMAAAAKGGWLQPGAIAVLEERADVAVSVDPSYLFPGKPDIRRY